MPKIAVTITQEELNQIIAEHFNLTSDIEVVVKCCENKNDWITWKGGDCPVTPLTKVEIMHRTGVCFTYQSRHFHWKHYNGDYDVIAYRIVKE